MKNIFLILISLIVLNLSYAWVLATNNTNALDSIQNTELNIKWAKLIEKYLITLTSSLDNLKNKYQIG